MYRAASCSCLREGRCSRRLRAHARGGVPPLQRLGALRGRSPRLACPVRPLGRLPLGGVYIGVGLWLGFRGNAPIPWGREYGWLGAGFPSQASLPQSGVPLF